MNLLYTYNGKDILVFRITHFHMQNMVQHSVWDILKTSEILSTEQFKARIDKNEEERELYSSLQPKFICVTVTEE